MVGVYYKDDWKNRCYVEIKNFIVLINLFIKLKMETLCNYGAKR